VPLLLLLLALPEKKSHLSAPIRVRIMFLL
jgi:hypothetical protein